MARANAGTGAEFAIAVSHRLASSGHLHAVVRAELEANLFEAVDLGRIETRRIAKILDECHDLIDGFELAELLGAIWRLKDHHMRL